MRLGLTCLALALGACQGPDRTLRSPDGQFSLQVRARRLRPMTYQPPGWAELVGLFGLSCGTAPFQVELSDLDSRPLVDWHGDFVTVRGVAGRWTLEPCRFVPSPPMPDTPY